MSLLLRIAILATVSLASLSSAWADGFDCHVHGLNGITAVNGREIVESDSTELHYRIVDITKDSANLLGDDGEKSSLIVLRNKDAIHFLEVNASELGGGIDMTSVFSAPVANGFLVAESRHFIFQGRPSVTHLVGTCSRIPG